MVTQTRNDTAAESEISVLVGGLVTVVFGLFAVMAAVGLGWAAATGLGVALTLVAWKVPATASARLLPYLIAGFAALAFLGAAFDLLT